MPNNKLSSNNPYKSGWFNIDKLSSLILSILSGRHLLSSTSFNVSVN